MLDSGTLLFPESGSEFLSALKAAALYSNGVHLHAITDPKFIDVVRSGPELAIKQSPYASYVIESRPALKRMYEYSLFFHKHADDLAMLSKAGLLRSRELVTEAGNGAWAVSDAASDEARTHILQAFESSPREISEALLHQLRIASREMPPCSFDLNICSLLLDDPTEAQRYIDGVPEIEQVATVAVYLATISIVAERLGAGCTTWSPTYRNALWAVRRIFSLDSTFEEIENRSSSAARLGHTVLHRYLPVIDDLPVGELLSIRERRGSELEAFRAGIAELATEIDCTSPPAKAELATRDLIAKRVDPAIRDLRRSIFAARVDALRKMGRSASSLAGASFPLMIGYAAGAPLDVSTIFTVLGGAAGAMIDAKLESEKLIRGSQWSFLLKLRSNRRRKF